MKLIIPRPGENLLELGKRCNGVYECPKDGSVRKGPLVVYAGKDSKGRNLVGEMYLNFRKIEVHLPAVEAFAQTVYVNLREQGLLDTFDTICGIPNGGRTLGQEIARIAGKKFAYPEKQPKETAPGKKQEYFWDLSQFDLDEGEQVAVAEDVFNNFQNTDTTLSEIAKSGAKVKLLLGAFNRSPKYDKIYTPKIGPFAGQSLPIVVAIRQEIPEYEQDDPYVAADIAAGKLELDVKKNWKRLCATMFQ